MPHILLIPGIVPFSSAFTMLLLSLILKVNSHHVLQVPHSVHHFLPLMPFLPILHAGVLEVVPLKNIVDVSSITSHLIDARQDDGSNDDEYNQQNNDPSLEVLAVSGNIDNFMFLQGGVLTWYRHKSQMYKQTIIMTRSSQSKLLFRYRSQGAEIKGSCSEGRNSFSPAICLLDLFIRMEEIVENEYRDIMKIILVGDAGTGKTNIVYCFTRDKIPNNIMPTIAVEFSSKLVTLDNRETVKTQIWDTAGQETYRSLTMSYYRKMHGAIIVYDVAKRTSFEHVRYWLQNVREKGDPNVQVCLLGHKTDQSRREVLFQQAEEFAMREHILYAQSSIKDPSSISQAFKKLINQINLASANSEAMRNEFKLNRNDRDSSGCSC